MKKYELVYATTGVPVRKVGFCSTFIRKAEAIAASIAWNKQNKNKIVVKEK